MTEREILLRSSRYPPEMLHHLGLITREECLTCWNFARTMYPRLWQANWDVVAYS